MIGQRVLHYQILEKLGEGGMGVVYKARDTRLDRLVALKFLPPERVADPERKRRFIREARAASGLNHPNIITIHDIASERGVDFMVMEYVAGKALDRLIPRKGLRLNEALKYAVEMADALAAAHAAGIVHRDVKPSNFMLTEKGHVKVLDFGLAKLTEPVGPEEETVTARTAEGTVLGTVAYMSPEQAEGKPVDARSDIFSFGSTVYHMLTGRRPFQGQSVTATLAAILHAEPKPISEVAEGVPPELERIVLLCLRKNPDRRFQHVVDVKIALEQLAEEHDSGRLVRRPLAARRRLWPATALVAIVALAAGAAAVWLWMRPGKPPAGVVLTRLTSDTGLTSQPDLSPDGKLLAYTSDRGGENLDIWVQELAGGSAIRLTQHPADDVEPAFSPDGGRIAFHSSRDSDGLYVIPTLGGEERLVARNGHRPRFSPDGRSIAYWVGDPSNAAPSGKIYVIPAGGGAPKQLVADFADARQPVWSPDGTNILFHGVRLAQEPADWWVAPLDGRPPVPMRALSALRVQGLTPYQGPARWIGDQLLFAAHLGDSINLWRATMRPGPWRLADVPERLTVGTSVEANPSATADGRMVFASIRSRSRVWSLKGDPVQGTFGTEFRPLVERETSSVKPALSDDGKTLVLLLQRTRGFDLLVKDLETGRERSLGWAPSDVCRPALTHDGSRVAYSVMEDTRRAIYVVALAQGAVEQVCENCGDVTGWSADGGALLYLEGQPGKVNLLRLAGREKIQLLRHPELALEQAHFSPDNRWIVFCAQTGSNQKRIFVAAYRDGGAKPPGEWIPITDGQSWDDKAEWSPDGNLLYYYSRRDGFGCLWKQPLDPTTKRPRGAAAAVAHFHATRFTLRNLALPLLAISVARDKIVFTAGEVSANIWMTRAEGLHPPQN